MVLEREIALDDPLDFGNFCVIDQRAVYIFCPQKFQDEVFCYGGRAAVQKYPALEDAFDRSPAD